MRNHITIIAEAGVNHNGELEIAKKLVDLAADAGADMIKFQTFKTDSIVSKAARKAKYQEENIQDGYDTQYQMLKKLELSIDQHEELIRHCEQRGIRFFSTAFDVEGLYYLNGLGFDKFKSPSGEITNYPYLKTLACLGKPVILSAGMANIQEIEEALEVLCSEGLQKKDITVLHCNTEYPTPMEDVNLRAMLTIRDTLGVNVGYSDHTLGIEVPIAAVALGAVVIEKHITLDRSLPGPDHQASLEPSELKSMVKAIRNIELAMSGNGQKEISKSEEKNLSVARKSIHLIHPLSRGTIIQEQDLIPLRPGDGISPMQWNQVIGSRVKRNIEAGEKLAWTDLEKNS